MSKFIFCCIALRQAFFYSLTFIVFGTLLLPSCQEAGSMEDAAKAQTTSVAIAERITPVRLATAQEKSFALQTLANGKVNALLQSKLYFKSQGTIEKISVSNGSLVKAGQVLAVLDNRQQAIALEQAKNLYRKAINDLNIEIVNYGGIDRDTNSVKPRILEALKVKVAYNEALTSIKNAKLQYDNTFLIAPYKGVIANLKAKPHNPAPTNEPFCTLLNTDNLIVEIAALEAELAHIQIGQNAQINPIALAKSGVPPSYNGNVIEINPMVSEQGLVLVKIKINKVDKDLIEGMNVNVSIEKNLEKQIIIPKAAVVERSGRKVVFTYENGLAKWHYVVVAYENSTEIAISEGLKAGEQVIIDGNLNLGHDAPVEVVKDDK